MNGQNGDWNMDLENMKRGPSRDSLARRAEYCGPVTNLKGQHDILRQRCIYSPTSATSSSSYRQPTTVEALLPVERQGTAEAADAAGPSLTEDVRGPAQRSPLAKGTRLPECTIAGRGRERRLVSGVPVFRHSLFEREAALAVNHHDSRLLFTKRFRDVLAGSTQLVKS
jgi:hypothetical protein